MIFVGEGGARVVRRALGGAMAYVTPIYGGSAGQIDYRLGITQHGCGSDTQFAYRADARERPLRWIGRGLAAFDDAFIAAGHPPLRAGGELTPAQHDAARRLMAGQHPHTGEQLVAPKLAVPADAKVPLAPLVAAVTAAAAEDGVADPAELFTAPKKRAAWRTAVRAVDRRGDAAVLRVDEALSLADAAGVPAEQVWPDTDLVAVYANLYEPRPVVDEHGRPVLDAAGVPRFELAPRRVPVGIVGYDIGITVPKSLSLLLAFAPDELVDRIEARYTAAVERTFAWTEDRASYVRRGKHGAGHTARQEASSGFAGWVMTHRAARPVGDAPVGDPHWHVHITIGNLARAADGTWLTIGAGGRELMRHAPAIDKVTQAQIRAALHTELGVTFARSDRGVWEVEHIPREAIRYFSKRGSEVTAALAQLGYTNTDTSAAEARVLTRTSRSAKAETTAAADSTLRELWRADAILGAGLDPDTFLPAVLAGHTADRAGADPVVDRHSISLEDLAARLADPEHGLTAHARRFSHLDALAAVADALPHGATVDEIEQLTDLVLTHPTFLALPSGVDRAGELVGGPGAAAQLAGAHQMTGGQLYTTRDVPAVERTILDAATTATPDQNRAVVAPATVDLALSVVEASQGFPLSAEQRDVLRRVVTNGRAIEAIEGPPGTGKTTLMRAAQLAWAGQGYRVAGAATAAVAAQNLAAESGIASRTVAQWLWRIEHRDGLAGVDVLVLDEANLTSDRDRARLYTAAAAAGTKIVEVGDPQQLRGVGCGSLFGYLHRLLDGPRLTENRRQRSAHERAALAAYRDGRHVDALRTWAAQGSVVATETSDQAVAAMAATWLHLRAGAPDPHTQAAGLLMLAATNEQVARINDTVQAVRHARGELGPATTIGTGVGRVGARTLTVHVGDQVLIRRNDRHGQAVTGDPVLNGYRGVVTGLTDAGVEVAWRDPATAELNAATLSPGYIAAGGLDLGYALTAHKAEGLTVGAAWDRPDGTRNHGTVLVYGPGLDNPGLYVSLSRDKGHVVLFGARAELEGDREDLVYGPPRSQAELTARVIAALAQHASDTAQTANDRPVLADLGRAPGEPGEPAEPEPQPEADPGMVTDEQRQQWRAAIRRAVAARQAGDADAVRAAHAERQALAEQLGADRVAVLRQEALQRLAQVRANAQRRAEQAERHAQLVEQWRARPLSTLTDRQLDHAVTTAARDRERHLEDAAHARQRLAEQQPAVAAGHGPRVTQLNTTLTELRRNAELQGQAEDIERRWQAVRATAGDTAGRAAVKDLEADRAPWWRPGGHRDRLHAEAAELRAHSARAAAEADQLARQAADLQQRLGGPGQWRLARERAERGEATYDRARTLAHEADQADLIRLRERITEQTAAAVDAGARHDELAAEQHLRATMPEPQRAAEAELRLQWHQQQHTELAAHQHPQLAPTHELDYHQRTIQQQEVDRGGPDIGL